MLVIEARCSFPAFEHRKSDVGNRGSQFAVRGSGFGSRDSRCAVRGSGFVPDQRTADFGQPGFTTGDAEDTEAFSGSYPRAVSRFSSPVPRFTDSPIAISCPPRNGRPTTRWCRLGARRRPGGAEAGSHGSDGSPRLHSRAGCRPGGTGGNSQGRSPWWDGVTHQSHDRMIRSPPGATCGVPTLTGRA